MLRSKGPYEQRHPMYEIRQPNDEKQQQKIIETTINAVDLKAYRMHDQQHIF